MEEEKPEGERTVGAQNMRRVRDSAHPHPPKFGEQGDAQTFCCPRESAGPGVSDATPRPFGVQNNRKQDRRKSDLSLL